ncbi:MAG: hypothetical protein N4A74_07500 [Carboxylicivirga sp.]|jgi:hypothetical protein|nr:hypothetical protein [Carboxylicivirga sp.]
MSTKDKVMISLIEDVVMANRIFDNISKVSNSDLYTSFWFDIVCLMGLDLLSMENDSLEEKYSRIFQQYEEMNLSNKEAALLLHNKLVSEIHTDTVKHSKAKA